MTKKLTEMFETETNVDDVQSKRSLPGTAEITTLSDDIADDIIAQIGKDLDAYSERFETSKSNNAVLDGLIEELFDIADADVEFFKTIPEDTQLAILRSQQSKRSRSKGKVMTLHNYKTLMSAAVAEHIIRVTIDKPKQTRVRRGAGYEYTDEELEAFAKDQDDLRREIRNLQSKKSIMKSKEDFDEGSDEWNALLKVEAQLKSLRIPGRRTMRVSDAISNELGDVAIEDLDADAAKELLLKLANA